MSARRFPRPDWPEWRKDEDEEKLKKVRGVKKRLNIATASDILMLNRRLLIDVVPSSSFARVMIDRSFHNEDRKKKLVAENKRHYTAYSPLSFHIESKTGLFLLHQ